MEHLVEDTFLVVVVEDIGNMVVVGIGTQAEEELGSRVVADTFLVVGTFEDQHIAEDIVAEDIVAEDIVVVDIVVVDIVAEDIVAEDIVGFVQEAVFVGIVVVKTELVVVALLEMEFGRDLQDEYLSEFFHLC